MRIALLYEHPTWSTELIARAHERGLDLVAVDVTNQPQIDAARASSVAIWVNRVNAMPSAGRPNSVVAATAHLLLSLEVEGQRIVNGLRCYQLGASKSAQATLFASLGLNAPSGIDIFDPAGALAAADQLGYPVLTKPNIGGSGSGIRRYDDRTTLNAAIHNGTVDLGIDGTGLVQTVIDSADDTIYRVEMLGTDFFYGTRQLRQPGVYNYCAADGCAIDTGAAIELFAPPSSVINDVAAIMRAAQTDVGGVEYLLDASTGEPVYYDFNPYSNFVSGIDDELGFNPIDRYLDFIISLI